MSKEEYDDFCRSMSGSVGIYDVYECREGHTTYTRCYDVGVTPYIIRCHCGKYAIHSTTTEELPKDTKVLKWYRPTYEEYERLSQERKEHITNGGLLLEGSY